MLNSCDVIYEQVVHLFPFFLPSFLVYMDSNADCNGPVREIYGQTVSVVGHGAVQEQQGPTSCSLTLRSASNFDHTNLQLSVVAATIRDCDVRFTIFDGDPGQGQLVSRQVHHTRARAPAHSRTHTHTHTQTHTHTHAHTHTHTQYITHSHTHEHTHTHTHTYTELSLFFHIGVRMYVQMYNSVLSFGVTVYNLCKIALAGHVARLIALLSIVVGFS